MSKLFLYYVSVHSYKLFTQRMKECRIFAEHRRTRREKGEDCLSPETEEVGIGTSSAAPAVDEERRESLMK